jgi:hypothetical protein
VGSYQIFFGLAIGKVHLQGKFIWDLGMRMAIKKIYFILKWDYLREWDYFRKWPCVRTALELSLRMIFESQSQSQSNPNRIPVLAAFQRSLAPARRQKSVLQQTLMSR